MDRRWENLCVRALMLGFSLVAVLLGTLVCAYPAAAQCGASGLDGFNTECGEGALANDTTGNSNSAFGYNALNSNTTSNYNSAFGLEALFSNTSGSDNTAVGYTALLHNTTGF